MKLSCDVSTNAGMVERNINVFTVLGITVFGYAVPQRLHTAGVVISVVGKAEIHMYCCIMCIVCECRVDTIATKISMRGENVSQQQK